MKHALLLALLGDHGDDQIILASRQDLCASMYDINFMCVFVRK